MRSMMRFIKRRRWPERILALAMALCLLPFAVAEEGIEDLQGETLPLEDGIEWMDQSALQASYAINMDADLRLGYVASASGEINPFNCTDRDLVSLNHLVFESIVGFDEEMKPAPLLADSWTVSGKEWTFKLREGVVFHNGAPLTAYEVMSTYQRFLLCGEMNPYHSRIQMIESMEVVDDLTLKVTSKYSGYVTLYAMTFPVVQSSTLDDRMARGTGPYWYTEYAAGSGVRLEVNPLWWKKDPGIQSIAARNYSDSGNALEALKTNEINILCTQSSHAAINRRISGFTSMDYTTNTYEMLVPNLSEDSPMGDVRMRQALMYGIDRAAIAENTYLGMSVQCEVPVNPSSWLYESQSAIYYYSPERALQLIKSCGWEDLTGDGMLNQINGVILKDLTLKLVTYNESTNTIRENTANLIANQLAKVGVTVEVHVYSKQTCLQRVKDKNYDIALVGVQLSEIPNLAPLFQKGGSLNLNNFKNDSMEQLLALVSSAQTEEELKSLYSQMQMIIVERLPVLGLLFRTGTVLSTRSLAGLSGLHVSNMLNGVEFMQRTP